MIATLGEALNTMARDAAEARTCAVEESEAEGTAAAAAATGRAANKEDAAAGECVMHVQQRCLAQRRLCGSMC